MKEEDIENEEPIVEDEPTGNEPTGDEPIGDEEQNDSENTNQEEEETPGVDGEGRPNKGVGPGGL